MVTPFGDGYAISHLDDSRLFFGYGYAVNHPEP